MAATFNNIKGWLKRAKEAGATHMIVATDPADLTDYPVDVMHGENPREKAAECDRVMECYSFALDIDEQLREYRAQNWD